MNLFKQRRAALAVVDSAHAQSPDRVCAPPERSPQVFTHGQGSWLWDDQGHAYLDFCQAGGSNTLGHSPQVLARALGEQAQALISSGGGMAADASWAYGERLRQATDSDQVHLLDSAAEACQGAIGLARQWGRLHRGGARHIIVVGQAFAGHLPHLCRDGGADVSQVPFNDLPALHAEVDSRTVAILLEPLQASSTATPATRDYFHGVHTLCRELGILFILDELHSGAGRCGALLAEQLYGVRADIVTLGKGLGGGVALAALLTRATACCNEAPRPLAGHAGHALSSAAGLAVLDTLLAPGFLAQVQDSARYLREGLSRQARRHALGEVDGLGLLCALRLREPQADALVAAARDEGLLIEALQPDSVRLSPALDVSRAAIDDMLRRLLRAFARLRHSHTQALGQASG